MKARREEKPPVIRKEEGLISQKNWPGSDQGGRLGNLVHCDHLVGVRAPSGTEDTATGLHGK